MEPDALEALRTRMAKRELSPDEGTSGALPLPEVERNDAVGRLAETASSRMVGPYKLLRRLGQGGMGVVHLAIRADEQYQQQVAIKVLTAREENREELLWRFRTERQILANFDHPHICRLFDGGVTEDGDPYFVMEYVRGAVRIDEYCRQEGLGVRERLRLFLQACDAVQYAHQHLVIHRDLKPSNILVRDDGEVKLMDFGIAKNLLALRTRDEKGQTLAGLTPMTPEYASPEQVRGEALGTSSDVYSLGVVLYELLTGKHPFDVDAPLHELLKSICETEPAKPSTVPTHDYPQTEATREVVRELSGDVDWIVMMALRKEPTRRYGTVEAMAEDVRRHLDGRPVQARPQTLTYRVDRFVRRHRTGVAAAGLLALTLAGGVVSTMQQARLAERRFQDVRELADSFLFDFHDAIAPLPGSTAARQLVAKKGLEYLDKLAKESSGDASLRLQLAAAYGKLADVQASLDQANIGDTQGAIGSYRKSLEIYQTLSNRMRTLAVQAQHGGVLLKTANLELRTGRISPALDHYGQARALAEGILQQEPANAGGLELLARVSEARSDVFVRKSETASALADLQQALRLAERLSSAQPERRDVHRLLWNIHRKLANVRNRMGQVDAALAEIAVSENLIRKSLAQFPNDADALRDLAGATRLGGDIQMDSGRMEASRREYQASLELASELSAADPRDTLAKREVGVAHLRLADLLYDLAENARAATNYEQARAIFQDLRKNDPANKEVGRDLRIALTSMGRSWDSMGEKDKAAKSYEDALALAEELAASDPQNQQWQGDLGLTLDRIARSFQKNQKPARALLYFRRELPITERLLGRDPADFEMRRRHILVLEHTGQCVRATEGAAAALTYFRDAFEQAQPVQYDSAFQSQLVWIEALDLYARALIDANNLSLAGEMLARADEAAEKFIAADPKRAHNNRAQAVIGPMHGTYATLLERKGDLGRAQKHRGIAELMAGERAHSEGKKSPGTQATAI